MELEQSMKLAIEEARLSLREGNHGFGTVIIKDGTIIASSHDQEDTANDSTSHAEMSAIREPTGHYWKALAWFLMQNGITIVSLL